MKRAVLIAGVLGTLAACGGSSGGTSGGGGSSSGSIGTGSTSLGTVLTDSRGFTLYYFTPEQGNKVVCAGNSGCNSLWPPVTSSSGAPSAPNGASGTFGVVTLPNGSAEVTYNGWPLHTYAQDSAAGQTNGQGVGGQWFVALTSLSSSGSGPGSNASPSSSATGYGY